MTWQQESGDLRERALSDPVYLDFARRRQSNPYSVISTVEDVLGERQSVVVVFAHMGALGDPRAYSIARLVDRSMPYLWTNQTRRAAAGLTLPKHIISPEFLPYPVMWWTFETDIDLSNGTLGWGMVWYGYADGIQVVTIGEKDGKAAVLSVVHMKRGDIYPDSFEPKLLEHVTGYLSMLSFLNSPYIPKTVERIAPKLRKTMGRAGWVERPSDAVSFVDLRPAIGEKGEGRQQSGAHKSRWIVRGHHRAQWYPSVQAHKVIWVAPYIKGPEGAPMKPTVYRVAR